MVVSHWHDLTKKPNESDFLEFFEKKILWNINSLGELEKNQPVNKKSEL